MSKIVYNACYGGFGLSDKARFLYKERTGVDLKYSYLNRADRILIEVVEELGEEANSDLSKLKIGYIPPEYFTRNLWEIKEYDGLESLKLLKERLEDKLEIERLQKENQELKDELVIQRLKSK